jgi:hypothetical protein
MLPSGSLIRAILARYIAPPTSGGRNLQGPPLALTKGKPRDILWGWILSARSSAGGGNDGQGRQEDPAGGEEGRADGGSRDAPRLLSVRPAHPSQRAAPGQGRAAQPHALLSQEVLRLRWTGRPQGRGRPSHSSPISSSSENITE